MTSPRSIPAPASSLPRSPGVGACLMAGLLAALLATQPACSPMFVRPPRMVPAGSAPEELDCTVSPAAAVVDTTFASAFLISSIIFTVLMADTVSHWELPKRVEGELTGASLVGLGLFAPSAVWGFWTTNQCGVLTNKLQLGRTPLPVRLPSPPPR